MNQEAQTDDRADSNMAAELRPVEVNDGEGEDKRTQPESPVLRFVASWLIRASTYSATKTGSELPAAVSCVERLEHRRKATVRNLLQT